MPTGVLDSGCSGIFTTVDDAKRAGLPYLGPSSKLIATAATDGALQKARDNTCLMYKGIPMEKLTGQTVPGFRDSLVGCGPFADAGLVTILHPHQGGVTIHRESDIEIRFSAPPLIQGYREANGNRMWRIPLRTTATITRVKDDGTILYNSETQ